MKTYVKRKKLEKHKLTQYYPLKCSVGPHVSYPLSTTIARLAATSCRTSHGCERFFLVPCDRRSKNGARLMCRTSVYYGPRTEETELLEICSKTRRERSDRDAESRRASHPNAGTIRTTATRRVVVGSRRRRQRKLGRDRRRPVKSFT